MINLPSLYQHQERLRDDTRAALARHGRVILCAQTGVGKTRTAKWILGASANREPRDNQTGRSLFTVHRRGLVDNAVDSFSEDPAVPHGVIMSGRETSYGRRIQIASIDTMLSWFVEGGEYPSDITFDLVVWDEAHSHHPKFAKFLKYHDARREQLGQPPAYVIGLTATPQAKGLADVYKEIILGPSTQWLIDNKYLSPFRYFRATQGKLGLLIKKGGEFTKESEALAMDGLAGDLVRDWKRFADGRPTVGFFPRRTHAQEAMQQLSEAGLRVAYVDGETPDDMRKTLIWQLNNHAIDYLCNVQVVERGTDIPRIGCVQLCVAIGSVVRYRQCIGRGSRVHPDKTDCCVARGTMILTDRGEVPIQDVQLSDRVWDGVEFCSHDGPVCNGNKEVIEWSGLKITPDHKVLTNNGWKEAEAAKACQRRAVVGGFGGTPIWTADHSNPHHPRKRSHARSRSGLLPLREAWLAALSQNFSAEASRLRVLHAEVWGALPRVDLAKSAASTAAVPVSTEPGIPSVRWARHRVLLLLNLRGSLLGGGESWATTEQVMDNRPNRQRRSLRTGQSTLGHDTNAVSQSGVCLARTVASEVSLRDVLRHATWQPTEARLDSKTDRGEMVVEVWDIRNVGPRNRYCANGVIVSNCVIDHGGNVHRHGFFEDDPQWSLDISHKEAGEAGGRPTIECPKCQAIYRGGKCRSCGYEPTPRERRAKGLEFDGQELKEVTRKEKPETTIQSAEDLLIRALYIAGKSGRTWRQCVGIFKGMSEKQGTNYRVPSSVVVNGHRYRAIRFGSEDSSRRVSALYPFTVERGNHSGEYLVEEQETEAPY